ncbi:MAG: hypothetical protein HFH68_00490 [Lachnospiraceae bacterium]|nr:hypothetical protein [Lachnospiraceae bacterium]
MKKGMVIFICMVFLPYMTSCGASEENKIAASIYDGQTETRLDVIKGITVRKVLEEAEIIINNEDIVVPSLDTKVTGEKMDISIKRNKDIDSIDGTGTDSNKEKDSSIYRNAEDNNTSKSQKRKRTKKTEDEEPRIISKEKIYDCDGSGHGYYLIKWSDGMEEYEDF